MYMVEMVTDLLSSDLSRSAADYKVARRSGSNLVRNMARHMELAIGPSKFELVTLAQVGVESTGALRKSIRSNSNRDNDAGRSSGC
jgi:hypothetical protein